jgi:hypothetical protein
MNPDAERDASLFGRIQAGIRKQDMIAEVIMARRRPKNCDKYPMVKPPKMEPVFIQILARLAAAFFRPLDWSMKVVYESWEVWLEQLVSLSNGFKTRATYL